MHSKKDLDTEILHFTPNYLNHQVLKTLNATIVLVIVFAPTDCQFILLPKNTRAHFCKNNYTDLSIYETILYFISSWNNLACESFEM